MVGLAAAVIVVAGLRSASGIVGPAMLALVLTIAVHPLRHRLARLKLPGWAVSLVCVVVVYLILIGLSIALVIATARFATLLPTYKPEFNALVHDAASWLSNVGVGDEQIAKISGSITLERLALVLGELLGALASVLSNLVFILSLVLFLAMDATGFPSQLATMAEARAPLAAALIGFAIGTRRYLLVSTVFGLIVACIDTVALALFAIPVPLLWGLLAFITNYIPNIGFIIGLVPPAVLALLEGGFGLFIAVTLVYSVINVVIQSVIQPKFVGDAVGLSTSLTFMSLVFWAWVLGALGALLAIPLSLLAKAILVDVEPRSRWLTPLLSNRTEPEPEPEPEPDPAAGPGRQR
ncbi:Predicted PurR-regulated permease PerM [Nocardioides alpinus]|nr:Predicted PurR-regulated permease PerM [Nocardioides alpinus]